jgi:Zn-finger nucleic acid-binding protein
MEKVLLEGITIDRCVRCKGEFYDAGEVEATTHAGCSEQELSAHLEEARCSEAPSQLRCSACGGKMTACEVSYLQVRFELDRCTECRGIWLDEDEPRKLREILECIAADCREAQSGLFRVLWLFRCF